MSALRRPAPAQGAVRLLGAALALLALLARAAPAGETPLDALKRGLRDERREARVAALREAARVATGVGDEERRKMALVLRKTLETDGDPAVRLETVATLSALRDEAAWVPVVSAAIGDRDEAVKEAATRAVLTARSDFPPVAAKLLREDQDPTYRAEIALLLGRRRRLDAAPVLLAALADPHPRVTTAAAEALEALSGEAHGWDAAAWKAWWERARASVAAPAPGSGDTVTREPAAPVPPPPPPPPRGLVPELYGVKLSSKDLVILVDVSGSIGVAGYESAKGELVRAVERLGSDVRLAALFFDETVRAWHPEMVRATPAAKADLARFVRGIPRGKRTDVMTPLNAGLAIVRRRIDEKVAAGETFAAGPVTMLVLSDGQENLRVTPGEVVGDKLDRLDLAHAVVDAIVLGGRDNVLMAALARRAGGLYVVVP